MASASITFATPVGLASRSSNIHKDGSWKLLPAITLKESASVRFSPLVSKQCGGRRSLPICAAIAAPPAQASPPDHPPVVEEPHSQMLESAAVASLFAPIDQGAPCISGQKASKVTVVGVGNVGMAIAQTMLTQSLVEELALVDVQADKLQGEMMDLQHAAAFLSRTRIQASTDYSVTAGSDVCIITAGARQREGESRLSLVGRNVDLLKKIVPQLVKYSPNALLLVISNPVDILTWAAWKISGLGSNQVIGSGTNLDSSRFRFLIAKALNVNTLNIHAYILGEHGDSSVPVWSSVSMAGIPILKFLDSKGVKYTEKDLSAIHRQVVDSAYDVIRLKGYTNWAIGYSTASIASTILRNQRRVQPLSVLAQGHYGITEEVFLSLPAVLGRSGCDFVAKTPLSANELDKLRKSATTLWEIQQGIDLSI